MKTVELGEFRDHAEQFLAGSEALAIEREGRRLGYYVPLADNRVDNRREFAEALDRLGETVERILDETGWTEDELVALLDLKTPESELRIPPRRVKAGAGSSGAAGD